MSKIETGDLNGKDTLSSLGFVHIIIQDFQVIKKKTKSLSLSVLLNIAHRA